MTCPICGGKTKVINSAADYESVYRKRKCVECGRRFETTEMEGTDADTLAELRREQKESREDREQREAERKFNKLAEALSVMADCVGFKFIGEVKLMHKKTKKEFRI
jgi:transcriptional regulator NrdR family protein